MKIPIVTKEDVIIAYKDRADIDYTKDIFRSASVWITNSEGDVLLAQRKFDKKVDPGKWGEAVGGTVEGQDSYKETAIREAKEELGLSNLALTLGPKQIVTEPCGYFVQWFTAIVDQPAETFKVQEDEVEQIAWIPYDQLVEECQTIPGKYIGAMADILASFPR